MAMFLLQWLIEPFSQSFLFSVRIEKSLSSKISWSGDRWPRSWRCSPYIDLGLCFAGFEATFITQGNGATEW